MTRTRTTIRRRTTTTIITFVLCAIAREREREREIERTNRFSVTILFYAIIIITENQFYCYGEFSIA